MLALGAISFGSILVVIPAIALYLDLYLLNSSYGKIFFWYYFGPVVPLLLLFPGIALFIHGFFLRKKLQSKEEERIIEIKLREREIILAIFSFVTGVFLIACFTPMILYIFLSVSLTSYVFSRLYGFLIIDFFLLTIPMFLYAYFLLRPMKNLRSKKILAIGRIIFGGILFFFLIVAIYSEFNYQFYYRYDFDVIDLINIILCVVMILPAMTLIIQGLLFLNSTKEQKKIGIKAKKVIFIIISMIFGVYILSLAIPTLLMTISFNVLLIFISSYGYLLLDLIFIAITLFLSAFFLIKPIKTLEGRRKLTRLMIITGVILILLPLITLSFDIYYTYKYMFSLDLFFNLVLDQLLLMFGVIVFIHGWFSKKKIERVSIF